MTSDVSDQQIGTDDETSVTIERGLGVGTIPASVVVMNFLLNVECCQIDAEHQQ